jgi:diguanylate cyclase (GGDEF)-like protein
MDQTLGSMSYSRARRLVLLAGLGILFVVAAVMYVRRVETVEVLATLLFIPVLVGFVLWDVEGGVLAAVLSAVAYSVLRYPAIDAVGFGQFAGLIASRSVAYVLFGVIGGWAGRQLESSIVKLELYDQIDDATSLYNARFFVQDTDLEISRSKRYQTIFSIAIVELPTSSFDSMGRRRGRAALKDIGRLLRQAVRTVDRCVHAEGGESHLVAVVMPETGREGAQIFTERLKGRLVEFVAKRGGAIRSEQVQSRSVTYPEDDEELEELRKRFAEVDRTEHPEQSTTTAPMPPRRGGT